MSTRQFCDKCKREIRVESVPAVTFRRVAYSAQHGPYCHQQTFDLCLPCYELMRELLELPRENNAI